MKESIGVGAYLSGLDVREIRMALVLHDGVDEVRRRLAFLGLKSFFDVSINRHHHFAQLAGTDRGVRFF